MRVSVEGGKYTYVNELGRRPCVLRYEEPWRDATGDKFIYCMASEIENLREEAQRLTGERDALAEAIRDAAVKAGIVAADAPLIWPHLLMLCNDLASSESEQLAALAEQNAKMRKVLLRLACLGNGDQYGNSIGNCIAQEALSLPNLATPVLNRIRAEGMRMAAEIVENTDVYTFVHGGSCYDDGGLTLSSAATTGYADRNYEEGTQ